MEEIINIEDFLKDFQMPLISYVAVFNPETGEVISVGPSTAFKNEKYTCPIWSMFPNYPQWPTPDQAAAAGSLT